MIAQRLHPIINKTIKVLGVKGHSRTSQFAMEYTRLITRLECCGNFSRIFQKNLDINVSKKQLFRNCMMSHEDFTLFLGGDRHLSESTIAASNFKIPGLGILVAHCDLNNDGSDNMWLKNVLSYYKVRTPEVVIIGTHDLDSTEEKFIKECGIQHFSVDTIKKVGIESVMDEVNWYFNKIKCPGFHLSIDIDVISESGMTRDEGLYITSFAREIWGDNFKSMDIVELNPLFGENSKNTLTMGTDLIINSLFSQNIDNEDIVLKNREDTVIFN